MKFQLIAIGKSKQPFVVSGIDHYLKRLRRYFPVELKEIPDIKGKQQAADQKKAEAEKLSAAYSERAVKVALDEHGKSMTSRGFANWIQQRMNSGAHAVDFLIGGPYGLDESVLKQSDLKLSLSDMTFPHDLVRLLFLEQLYRAMTILRNEPYHHD